MTTSDRIISPSLLPIFRYWVIGIVVLVMASPTDIPIAYRMYMLLVYACLFFYPLISPRLDLSTISTSIDYAPIKFRYAFLLLIVEFISISIATQFYTGEAFISSFVTALSGQNTYGAYQEYFSEAGIANMSPFSRAGYVLLLGGAKLIFVFSVINFFLSRRRDGWSLLFMVSAATMYLGFGLARGTFFEVFEIACAILYFWFMTSVARRARRVERTKAILYFSILGSAALIGLFVLNAMRRYEDATAFFQQCSPNFCFSPWGLTDYLEFPIYILTVYFGNGGYFIASLFDATITQGQTAYLIPFQSVIFHWGASEFGVRSFMCERFVECQFVWTPEVATVISIFGILAFFVTNIGIMALARLENHIIKFPSLSGMMLLYFMFMLVISMPVANFFTISTPSIISTAILISFFTWQKIKPWRPRGKRKGRPQRVW